LAFLKPMLMLLSQGCRMFQLLRISKRLNKQKPQQIIKSVAAQCLIESLNVISGKAGNSQFQPLQRYENGSNSVL
jgi:hypothetical protein